MNEQEVMDWMREQLGDGSNAEVSALGMMMADIGEFGFDAWLSLPCISIVDGYAETTASVFETLHDQYKFAFEEQQMLRDASIETSSEIDPAESIKLLCEGVIETFSSMSCYLELRSMANAHYNK